MYRHCANINIRVWLAVLLVGSGLLMTGLSAAAGPAWQTNGGNPLPNDCSDVTAPGEDPPACCASGYVYYNDVPVAGAQVEIRSASGVFTTTTSTGPSSVTPYYASALSASPLNVSPGDTITITATYDGATTNTVYQEVVGGGQQVDVVIPAAEGDHPPISTIHYIYPNPAGQRWDTVIFSGSGADGDAEGAGIAAWEWTSDLDGELSTQEKFSLAASGLMSGTHTIAFRVQDDEGNWSGPVVRTLEVTPMAFDIDAGWQVLVFPALPDADYDAKRLLEDIAAQGGCPAEVSRWVSDLGNWGGYLPELPFGNFGLTPWHPYFLRANCASELQLPAGFTVAPGEAITLTTGWNFVALPPTVEGLTAAEACQQIADQGGAVDEIDRWAADVGNWAGHLCGKPFGDFALTSQEGYFIRSQADSVWRPEAIIGGARKVFLSRHTAASTRIRHLRSQRSKPRLAANQSK